MTTNNEILLKCIQSNCCLRCSLRYSGCTNFDIYEESEKEISTQFEEFKHYNIEQCISCYGLFQDDFLFGLLEKIVEGTKDYQLSNYNIILSIPLILYVNQRSMYLHLNIDSISLEIQKLLKAILIRLLNKKLNGVLFSPQSPFQIKISFLHSTDKMMRTSLLGPKKKKPKFRRGKEKDDSILFEKAIRSMNVDEFKKEFDVPPRTHPDNIFYQLHFKHLPIYFTGNYMKLERGVSQTRWIVKGQRLAEKSVDEIIGEKLLSAVNASKYTFHAAGREDSDVRMLGNGRQFVIEFEDPKKVFFNKDELKELEKQINETESVNVSSLALTDKSIYDLIIKGAEMKRKKYRCVVWVKKIVTEEDVNKLNAMEAFEISQITPIRVLHRRNWDERKRTLYTLKCTKINDHYLIVDVTTQAGTYIKEFIHGDFGRTSPSFGDLLQSEADILQLDVMDLVH